MRKLKILTVIAFILLCGVMVITCGSPSAPPDIVDGWRGTWDWEVRDDRAQTRFAAGISILEGWHPCPYGRRAQTFVLNEPYIPDRPDTGRIALQGVEGHAGLYIPVMEDLRGFCPQLAWPENKGAGEYVDIKIPTLVETMGPRGEPVEAMRFSGTLMQRGSESPTPPWVSRNSFGGAEDYRRGAGWPSITVYATPPGLEDQPDQETRWAFMDGYGYTFWVRPMLPFIAYRTSVENWDYRPYEGHEPGHWFGTAPGRDGTEGTNFTPAPVGQWTQVRVVYDPFRPDFNMAVNNWIFSFGIQENFPLDDCPTVIATRHNKDHSMRIVFHFHLQHNGGEEGAADTEFSVLAGRHDFEVYLYGLEILK